jgi:hypothetical protein
MELSFHREMPKLSPAEHKNAKDFFKAYGNHIVLIDQVSLSFLGDSLMKRLDSFRAKAVDFVGSNDLKKRDIFKAMDPHRFY